MTDENIGESLPTTSVSNNSISNSDTEVKENSDNVRNSLAVRYDHAYHLYDITQKIRDTAQRFNFVERLNSEYRSANGISIDSISENDENVIIKNSLTVRREDFEKLKRENEKLKKIADELKAEVRLTGGRGLDSSKAKNYSNFKQIQT
jgi:hypothetical protein